MLARTSCIRCRHFPQEARRLLPVIVCACDCGGTGTASLADAVYPVGSIYMSVNSTDPGALFGGTWSRIQGRFLLAAGGGYSAGSTGGEAEHTLSVSEMPSHSHQAKASGSTLRFEYTGAYLGIPEGGVYNDSLYTATSTVQSTGGSQAHNNMPPYIAVYVWERTA